jgi:hypothetical protein
MVLMDRDRENVPMFVERPLRAIAVVDIPTPCADVLSAVPARVQQRELCCAWPAADFTAA